MLFFPLLFNDCVPPAFPTTPIGNWSISTTHFYFVFTYPNIFRAVLFEWVYTCNVSFVIPSAVETLCRCPFFPKRARWMDSRTPHLKAQVVEVGVQRRKKDLVLSSRYLNRSSSIICFSTPSWKAANNTNVVPNCLLYVINCQLMF